MLAYTVNDEPSMESILTEVRRILIEEEAARLAPPQKAAKGESLLLTQMLAADGSVISIAPSTKAYEAIRPMARPRNAFAEIDALRSRVSDLVEAGSGGAERARDSAWKTVSETRRMLAEAATVNVATISAAPVIASEDQTVSIGGAVARTEDRPPLAPKKHDRSGAPAEPAGAETGANGPRDPAVQIQRMLAHQMAAAHEAVLSLTSAAVEQIRGGEDEAPLPAARGRVRAMRKRKDGDEAARLADTAVRMMQAYNTALTTLMSLGGEAAQPIGPARAGAQKKRSGARRAGAKRPKQSRSDAARPRPALSAA
jgi:hypothetical protein